MDIGIGLFLALLIVVLLIVVLFWGMHLGLEMAVDGTRTSGCFRAYGKQWIAVETRPAPIFKSPNETKDRNAL